MKRKIIAVTGARSEYDLLYSVYQKLNNDENFDFGVIICGPHLSETYGYTAKYIEKDDFRIAGRIYNLIDSNQKAGRIVSIGVQIPSLTNILVNEKPDIVLVAGDREESISVTMTCAFLDIPVAHFFGGDIAKDGNIDNSVRYAASKFAHIHFPTLEAHRETLLKLGEDAWRIFVVGNPALDRILDVETLTKESLFEKLGVSDKKIDKYCVLIQHPIITQIDKQSEHIRITLDAILEQDIHCFVNFPNSDAGNQYIIEAYKEYGAKYPEKFTIFQNADRISYINLLRLSEFLMGNSSSGIIEIASFKKAAINIGERQRGRIHAENVIFVDNDKEQIKGAINKVLHDQDFRTVVSNVENPYGKGDSAEKVVQVLREISLNTNLIHKNITY
jgi:GDP/UDP-N,N'-diacetylbacillosamine 2-epimerase (hydrolysing)